MPALGYLIWKALGTTDVQSQNPGWESWESWESQEIMEHVPSSKHETRGCSLSPIVEALLDPPAAKEAMVRTPSGRLACNAPMAPFALSLSQLAL